eukprot:TRINITY_DN939_c1_g2_i1.p1 TRINITY_DN939_c1_g2~~TRINITY_DN939_c1_g2_i1.p1  ORF type:complete len:353 (+),score=117.33 TRINITY_DN939_c1_g2_i1:59-1060(+)
MELNAANAKAQLRSWWVTLPLATQVVFVVCAAVYAFEAVGLTAVTTGCSGAASVLGKWKVWRLATSPIYHAGLLHVALNLMALLSLLPPIERSHGTSGAFCIAAIYALLAQFFAILPATVLHVLLGIDHVVEWRSCYVGLSGVLFGLLTLECTTDATGLLSTSRRQLCGVAIPGRAYPWVLACLLQLLFHDAAFAVHAGGILAAQVAPPLALRKTITAFDGCLPAAMKSVASFVPANRAPLSGAQTAGGSWPWRSQSASPANHPAAAAAAAATNRSASLRSGSPRARSTSSGRPPAAGETFPGSGHRLGTGDVAPAAPAQVEIDVVPPSHKTA